MTFLEKFKRAIGFGPMVDTSDPLYADSNETDLAMPISNEKQVTAKDNGEPKPVEFDVEMQDAIFEKVVEVFNKSLPEFISGSVDAESQKRYLRESLDEGIRKYLESVNVAAREYCERQWKARQKDMAAEIEAIKLKAEDVERRSSDIQQKQLSADRQKRALTERVHDLESQLARIESEREQYELENRSLLSRLKVAAVHQDESEKLSAELQSATAELSRLRENPDAVALEREEKLNAKISEMQEGIDTLKEQIRLGDEIRDDLRGKLKHSEEEVASRDKEITELQELIKEFDVATDRMEKAQGKMEEMQRTLEIQAKTIEGKDREIDSLKKTIAENAERYAEQEKALHDEIDDLRNSMLPAVGKDLVEEPIIFDEEVLTGNLEEEDTVPIISDDEFSAISASFDARENNAGDYKPDNDEEFEQDLIDFKEFSEEASRIETPAEPYVKSEPEAIAAEKPFSYNLFGDDSPKHRGRAKKQTEKNEEKTKPRNNPEQLSLF